MTPDASTISLFGKLPSAGDFVRAGQSHGAASALARWLQESVELARGASPAEPVFFAARFPESAQVTVGVWMPSADRVGRAFPLCASTRLPDDFLGLPLAQLPASGRTFFDDALALLRAAPQLAPDLLSARVAALEPPHPSSIPGAWERCAQALHEDTTQGFLERVFAEPAQGAYAFHTLIAACRGQATSAPELARVVLDCPIAIDLDVCVWVDAVRRRLPAQSAPSIFWTEETPRLLVSLGPPPPVVFRALADEAFDGVGRWPLWTASREALGAAEAQLPETVRAALASDVPLQHLLDALEP